MPRKLTRKLITLSILAAALAVLSPSPATSTSRSCYYAKDEWGNCVEICCDPGFGCVSYFCAGRK